VKTQVGGRGIAPSGNRIRLQASSAALALYSQKLVRLSIFGTPKQGTAEVGIGGGVGHLCDDCSLCRYALRSRNG
jgi:hypothetical protein